MRVQNSLLEYAVRRRIRMRIAASANLHM